VLTWILSVLIGGLIIGALGRLIVPGPNPMGILGTILVGIGGSIIGGIVARLLWLRPQDHFLGLIVLEVLGAALVVALLTRSRPRSRHRVF
jgi:uncharacterized membrane protein YeaQ/YmgE (transglycosylase-associated protein family)